MTASKTRSAFTELLRQRILVLDGAMGTMIQALKLDEEGYRGARFDAWNREVRGNNDLLNLSRPDAVRDIHLAYFRAGADIVSTNTLPPQLGSSGPAPGPGSGFRFPPPQTPAGSVPGSRWCGARQSG